MKKILFFIILFISLEKTSSQSIFKVVEAKRTHVMNRDSPKSNYKYYRIVSATDTSIYNPTYPIITNTTSIDTIEAIKELLALKGDTRICAIPIMSYNPLRSQIYMGDSKNYSIQVEALFIINQLVFGQPFVYSSYPILVDKYKKEEASISGTIVDEAYGAYCNWYKKLKKNGLKEIRYKKVMPLDGTSIKWY